MNFKLKQVYNYLARLREVGGWLVWIFLFLVAFLWFTGAFVASPTLQANAVGMFPLAVSCVILSVILETLMWLLKKVTK